MNRSGPNILVADSLIQFSRRLVVLGTDREADSIPAPPTRLVLGCASQPSRNPTPTLIGHHEDVLNLRHANMRPLPGDVSVTDRPIILPSDQIRRTVFRIMTKTTEGQMQVNELNFRWTQLSHSQHTESLQHPARPC